MQDKYEQQQDQYYQKLRESRAKKKYLLGHLGKNLLVLLIGNAFVFVIYLIFVGKLVSEKVMRGDDVSMLICCFGFLMQLAMLIVVSWLRYARDEVEHRAIIHLSREENFSPASYYVMTWKRFAWTMPLAYLIMQLPFMLYYAVLGYFYEAETLFAHFYIPQLALCELTRSGFLGCMLNAVLLALIYGICLFLVQKNWLRDRIRK